MFRKTPGSASSNTPSLASARRSRCSASGVSADLVGQIGDGDRPVRKRLGDAEIGDLAECASHQRPSGMSHSTVSGERELMRARATAAATSSASASSSVRQSSSRRPSRTMPTRAARPRAAARRQPLLDGAGEARQLGERQRAAADAADRLLDLAADGRGEPLGPRAHRLRRLVQHPQHRHLPQRPLRVEVERERPLERGERELVGAQRALERVPAQALDEVGAAHDDPGLRPAEQLVAREADEVGAGGEALARRRLVLGRVDEHARAEVVHERQSVALRHRRELARPTGCSVKPTTRKFDWCTRRSSAVSGPIARS